MLRLFDLPELRHLGASPRWLPVRVAFTAATAGYAHEPNPAPRGTCDRCRQCGDNDVLNLRVGEVVEVRGKDEILATLDERGELEALPFMPEMLQFCGRRFRVDKLALKLCDTINWSGMYRMDHAVHLAGVRCDGQAHGGCQAGCLVYWKEAWLKRVDGDVAEAEPGPPSLVPPGRVPSTCWRRPARPADPAAPGRRSTPARRPSSCGRHPSGSRPGTLSQYVLDVRSGNASLGATVRSVLVGAFNEYQDFSRRRAARTAAHPVRQAVPVHPGTAAQDPQETLDLRPGSWCGSSPSRRSSRRWTPTTATGA